MEPFFTTLPSPFFKPSSLQVISYYRVYKLSGLVSFFTLFLEHLLRQSLLSYSRRCKKLNYNIKYYTFFFCSIKRTFLIIINESSKNTNVNGSLGSEEMARTFWMLYLLSIVFQPSILQPSIFPFFIILRRRAYRRRVIFVFIIFVSLAYYWIPIIRNAGAKARWECVSMYRRACFMLFAYPFFHRTFPFSINPVVRRTPLFSISLYYLIFTNVDLHQCRIRFMIYQRYDFFSVYLPLTHNFERNLTWSSIKTIFNLIIQCYLNYILVQFYFRSFEGSVTTTKKNCTHLML